MMSRPSLEEHCRSSDLGFPAHSTPSDLPVTLRCAQNTLWGIECLTSHKELASEDIRAIPFITEETSPKK